MSSGCDTFWKFVSVLFVVLTLVAVIIGAAMTINSDAIQRFSLRAVPVGEAGAQLWGPLTFDSNNNHITFTLRYLALSDITAIHVRGPIVLGSNSGPIAAVLCGGPGPLPVCALNAGEVSLTTVKQVWDGITPTAQDVRILTNTIRENPHLYYVEVLTVANPVSPGAMRAPLEGISGLP